MRLIADEGSEGVVCKGMAESKQVKKELFILICRLVWIAFRSGGEEMIAIGTINEGKRRGSL